MVKRAGVLIAFLATFACGRAVAADWAWIDTVRVGGRFDYRAQMDRESVPFPWNSSTHSALDRTRMMLDFNLGTVSYGKLYLKGAALWDNIRQDEVRKRLRFEQGDYLWWWSPGDSRYSARLFANERRFFVGDMIAPLLRDDLVIKSGDNRGIRLDATIDERLGITALFSELGPDNGNTNRISYVRAAYSLPVVAFGASYLYEDPELVAAPNHAVFKGEASSGYKNLFVVLSYHLAGFQDQGVFFPNDDTALITEVRLTSIRLRRAGRLRFVYRYATLDDRFENALGIPAGAEDGHTIAMYFRSTEVSFNGRLLYHYGKRKTFEDKQSEWLAAGVWGHFNPGVEFFLRGGLGEVKDEAAFDSETNFIHGALHHDTKKLRSGIHIMWQDLGTIYSEVRFAVDGKLVLSPNWGIHWWLAGGREFDVNETIFARLEYRPSNRIFITFGYGWRFVGDGPFLLEDPDFNLSGLESAVYAVTVRGDF